MLTFVVTQKVGIREMRLWLQFRVQISNNDAQMGAQQITEYFHTHFVALAKHVIFGFVMLVVIGIGF